MSNGLIRIEDLHDSLRESQYDTTKTTTTEVTRLNCLNKNLVSLAITGKTIVNLLGVAGNCEDTSLWTTMSASISLDSSNKAIGSNSFKLDITAGVASAVYRDCYTTIDKSKYYGVSAYLKNGNAKDVTLFLADNPMGTTPIKNSESITDTTKFNRVWVKVQPSNLTNITAFAPYIQVAGTALGQYGYVDGVMLEEITQEQYDDPNWKPSPFIVNDSSVGDTATNIVSRGRNLIDVVQGYYANWNMPDRNPLAIRHSNILINVKPNTTYSVSISSPLNYVVHEWDVNRAWLFYMSKWSTTPVTNFTITTTANTNYVSLAFKKDDTTPIFPEDYRIMMNEGSTSLPYESYQSTVMQIPYQLREIKTFNIYDTQDTKKGKVIKRIMYNSLDGSLPWVYESSSTGVKKVVCPELPNSKVPYGSHQITYKHNNKILKIMDGTIITFNDPDVSQVWQRPNEDKCGISLTVANSESGWGQNYTNVTPEEIKAYFNGWKMYVKSQPTQDHYNGTGEKAWVELSWKDKSTDPNVGQHVTYTCPTTLAPGYTPYRLYYQLAQPQEINIPISDLVGLPGGSLIMENDAQSWVRPTVAYTACKNSRANLESLMQEVARNNTYEPLNGVYATTQSITYYVDANKGDDVNNNGLSPDKPFKTIMKAVNSLPQVINHSVYIYVADGTYDESLFVRGFSGRSTLFLIGNINSISNCKIRSISISTNSCAVVMKGLCCNISNTEVGFWVSSNPGYAYIGYCKTTALCSRAIEIENGSNALIEKCDISSSWRGIWCVTNSSANSINNTSSGGNQEGLRATGSTIMKVGTQPSGTTAEVTENGGMIR